MLKHFTFAVVCAFALVPGVEAAEDRYKRLGCYQNVTVPAQYSVKHVLIKKPERKYVKIGDIIELREYPAVYKEEKTLIKPEHKLLKEVACPKKSH